VARHAQAAHAHKTLPCPYNLGITVGAPKILTRPDEESMVRDESMARPDEESMVRDTMHGRVARDRGSGSSRDARHIGRGAGQRLLGPASRPVLLSQENQKETAVHRRRAALCLFRHACQVSLAWCDACIFPCASIAHCVLSLIEAKPSFAMCLVS